MGSTLMAAFQVAVAAKTANPIAIKAAAGSTLKAINNWSEALNEPKATVNIDEITN
jgi:hypothetical protein